MAYNREAPENAGPGALPARQKGEAGWRVLETRNAGPGMALRKSSGPSRTAARLKTHV